MMKCVCAGVAVAGEPDRCVLVHLLRLFNSTGCGILPTFGGSPPFSGAKVPQPVLLNDEVAARASVVVAGELFLRISVHLRGRMWNVGRKEGNDAAVLLSVDVADATDISSIFVIIVQ